MALAIALVGAGPALGCSIVTQAMVFFNFRSTEINAQGMNTLKRAGAGRAESPALPAACQQFTVTGHMDTAEAATPDAGLDVARAEAVRQVLEQRGAHVSRVAGSMGQLLVPTGPGVREPQNRYVEVRWTVPAGRWRCDPATEQESFTPACIGRYRACYYELTDGTACNFDGVPDPSPQRYSVFYP